MSIVAGKDIGNLRLKDRLKRNDTEMTVPEKTRNPADAEFNFQNGYTSVDTTVSKSLRLPTYLYFKKTPPLFH